jgi:drug/metabolite transporter (DMT)-like permease
MIVWFAVFLIVSAVITKALSKHFESWELPFLFIVLFCFIGGITLMILLFIMQEDKSIAVFGTIVVLVVVSIGVYAMVICTHKTVCRLCGREMDNKGKYGLCVRCASDIGFGKDWGTNHE